MQKYLLGKEFAQFDLWSTILLHIKCRDVHFWAEVCISCYDSSEKHKLKCGKYIKFQIHISGSIQFKYDSITYVKLSGTDVKSTLIKCPNHKGEKEKW